MHRLPSADHKLSTEDEAQNYVYMHPHTVQNRLRVQQPNSCRQLCLDDGRSAAYGNHPKGLPAASSTAYDNRHIYDSSYADESETEYSDEDREYVYYVNRPSNHTASHV